MGFDISQFRNIAANRAASDQIDIDRQNPQAPTLTTRPESTGLAWLLDQVIEFGDNLLEGPLFAQQQAVLQAFHDALSQGLSPQAADAVLAREPIQPLTAGRVATLIQQAEGWEATRMAALQLASQPGASTSDMDTALDYVLGECELPEGAHSALIVPTLRDALRQVLPALVQADGTARLELAGRLASQLAPRIEEYIVRALFAQSMQPASTVKGLNGKSADEVIATLDSLGGLARLHQDVPALNVHLQREVAGFVTCLNTLLNRVDQDKADIGTRFFGDNAPGKLQGIRLTDSDPHKQGNRVAILSFGADRQVVYKPRDVRIDEALSGAHLAPDAQGPRQSLLEMAGADAMTYRFLPRQQANVDYGYVQFLPHGDAQDHVIDATDAPRVFGDLGRAIGALMLAGASDLHHENIMVSGGRFYFTDLEFALSPQAIGYATQLLSRQPGPLDADGVPSDQVAARAEYDDLMRSMILNDTFQRATDNNPLCSPCTVAQGRFHPADTSSEVIESLVILRTVGPDGTQYLDNRRAPDGEDDNLYARYHQPFGQGVTAGLKAVRDAAGQGLPQFHASIPDFHLRYHPISTGDQRTVLSDLRFESFNASALQAVNDLYDGTTPTQSLDDKLADITLCSQDAAKLNALRQAMYGAYQQHDIPYFSRQVSGQALFPDGMTNQPFQWGPGPHDYFPTRADTHAQGLEALLAGVSDAVLDRLGTLAGSWMSEQSPREAYVLQFPNGKTQRMIDDITRQ